MDRYRVVGPRAVAGVKPGGLVELDPATVNVDALLEAGHIRPAPPRATRATARSDG